MSYRALWAVAALVMVVERVGAVPPRAGEAFPDLGKAQLEGVIPDLAGKVVLVDFWASWCGPCKQSFPVMDELQQEYKDKGFLVVAINVDEDKKDMEKFLKEHPVAFTVLRDVGQKLVESVNLETMPTSFLLDGKGKIVAIHRKYEGKKTEEQIRKEIEELLGLQKEGRAK